MVTGSGVKKIVDKERKEFLTVFIATTPSPVTGFVILVPKDEAIDAGMTIEDAFRFIVSGGVISPQLSKGNKIRALPILEPAVKE
jgi:uncharacterized membrane protein